MQAERRPPRLTATWNLKGEEPAATSKRELPGVEEENQEVSSEQMENVFQGRSEQLCQMSQKAKDNEA